LKILRTQEILDRLDISRSTLWRWEREGVIPPRRKIGPNVTGLLETELNDWLESRPPVVGAANERGAA